jgi:hypothetical protein
MFLSFVSSNKEGFMVCPASDRFDRDVYQRKLTLPGFPLELRIHGISPGIIST